MDFKTIRKQIIEFFKHKEPEKQAEGYNIEGVFYTKEELKKKQNEWIERGIIQ